MKGNISQKACSTGKDFNVKLKHISIPKRQRIFRHSVGRYQQLSQRQNSLINMVQIKNILKNQRKSMNISQSASNNHVTDIYFDRNKKSKFMKNVIDEYFEDSQLNSNSAENGEVYNIMNNLNSILKNKKTVHKLFLMRETEDSKEQKNNTKRQYLKRQQQKQLNKHKQKLPQNLPVQKNNLGSNINQNQHHKDNSSLFNNIGEFGGQKTGTCFFLPPIQQLNEDYNNCNADSSYFDLNSDYEVLSEAHKGLDLGNLELKQNKERILVYQNEAFRVYTMLENSKPIYRLKEFKYQGAQILKREEKAKRLGVETIWTESKINSACYLSQFINPLKNMICKILPNLESNQNLANKSITADTLCKFKIKSTNYRKYLLANNCLQLKHLLREVCIILKKNQNKIINNKVNPSNLFYGKGNKVVLGQWGYSAFREQHQIQSNKFESRINPILKIQSEWLTTPEYLSPQILMAISANSPQEEPDIWDCGIASDIWSLGLTLFEIITMIPLWMNEPCIIRFSSPKKLKALGSTPPDFLGSILQLNPSNKICSQTQTTFSSSTEWKNISLTSTLIGSNFQNNNFKMLGVKPRIGLLATQNRCPENILLRQKNLQKIVLRCLQNEVEEHLNPDILQVVSKMIKFDPSQRINLSEILEIIK